MKTCKRCHAEKPVASFTPHGAICWDCKTAAAATVDARRVRARAAASDRRQSKPRECTKCATAKPAEQFPKFGKICWNCKGLAKEQRLIKRRVACLRAYHARKKTAAPGGKIYCMGEEL